MNEPLGVLLQARLRRAKSKKDRAAIKAELNPPPAPPPLQYLLDTYFRLRRRKGSSGFGLSPIEWGDFGDFQRNTAVNLSPWEIAILENLDDLYLAAKSGVTLQPGAGTDGGGDGGQVMEP